MKSYGKICALLTGILFASSSLQYAAAGIILAPGGFAASVLSSDPGAGTLLASTAQPFANSVMAGTLISSVWVNDPFNTHGGLTFTYSFTLNASSTHAASEFTVSSFDSFLTDVSFNPAAGIAGGIPPSFFSRSTEGGTSGQVMRFGFFGPAVMPGAASALLVIETDAQIWAPSFGAIIDGQAVNVGTLAPVPVPEPGIFAFTLAGLGMLLPRLRSNR